MVNLNKITFIVCIVATVDCTQVFEPWELLTTFPLTLPSLRILPASSGNVVEAVRHARQMQREIRTAQALSPAELYGYAKQLGVPLDLLQKTAKLGRLPVVNFAAGGLGKMYKMACL